MNNQNYILGKTEKKKILNKFFVEKLINLFHNFIAKVNLIIKSKYFFIILYVFSVIILYLIIQTVIGIILPSIAIISLFYAMHTSINFNNPFSKSFFLSLNFSTYIFKVFMFMILFFILMFIVNLESGFLFIISIISIFILSILNYVNIILLLFLTPFFLIILIDLTIYFFIFKWTKWYKIIKFLPNTKILKKFNILEKKYAENSFYKIELK